MLMPIHKTFYIGHRSHTKFYLSGSLNTLKSSLLILISDENVINKSNVKERYEKTKG